MSELISREDFKIVQKGTEAFYVYYYAPHWFFWRKWKPAFSYTNFDGGDKRFFTRDEAEQAIQERYLSQARQEVKQ